MRSVHPLAAVHGSTVTGDLVLVVFEVKLIVIAQLPTAKTQSQEGQEGRRKGPCLHVPGLTTSKQNISYRKARLVELRGACVGRWGNLEKK